MTLCLKTKMRLSNRPEAENLLGIYSSLNDQSLNKSINEFLRKKIFSI